LLFYKALQSRMAQVLDNDSKLPIVVLDTMLPRQVMKIQVENEIFQSLVMHCVQTETPRFGMIGTATLSSTGQAWPLQNGVEVELVDPPLVVDGNNNNSNNNNKALRVKLKALRRFRINEGELQTNPAGWTEARVIFLDDGVHDTNDPESLARAIQVATQLTGEHPSNTDTTNLVTQWIDLAKTKEHFPGQIDQLLEDLGDLPAPENPTDLAMWIGALINPLPAMGVAMEIRPQLLMARSAEERINIAYKGLLASIQHMNGTKPLF
jgi:ATP-dependent protease La (LON) substrate-binding domain